MKTCAVGALALAVLVTVAPSRAWCAPAIGDGTSDSPYELPEVDEEIRVDGVLDEDVWKKALSLDLCYETNPGENTEPKVRTEVLLAYSRTHLFVAFRAYDPDPTAICATVTDRDNMYNDDRLSFILDTFNDQRRGYMFFVNPFGIQGDALDSYGMGGGDPAWDTLWDSEGRITDYGYVVEASVPFSSLRFQRSVGKQVWGIGFGRKYSREFDYRMALRPRDRNETCYLCQVAKFRGFDGVTPGRNVELDPTLSWVGTQSRGDFPRGDFGSGNGRSDVGLTARWGVTPNLVLSGAANPDFSQVEADAFELEANTRFAIYYDEKRPFFLEGMEHFQMQLNPVYTRTIADPSWGLKLTGKEGANALGAFVVRDRIANFTVPGSQGSWPASIDMPVTDAAVRYRRDIASASTAGLVFTAREGDEYRNLMGGVDGNLRFTPSDRLQVQALTSLTDYPDDFAADTEQPLDEFEGRAFDAEFAHDSGSFDWWAAHRRIEGGFRSDMGYRPQTDFRQTRGGWSYAWRADAGWYTVLNSGFGYVHNEDLSGRMLESYVDYWADYAGPLRSEIGVYGVIGRENYGGRDYDNSHVTVSSWFWPTGSTYLGLDASVGKAVDYTNGLAARRVYLQPELLFNLGRRLDVTLSHQYERLNVDEGTLYVGHITYLRAAFHFTRRAFLRAILQYEHDAYNTGLYTDGRGSAEEDLASQILFTYRINAQTVLYLGYSDSHEAGTGFRLTQKERTLFAKIGYALVL